MTVKGRLFQSDEKDRYFHIYYNERKRIGESEQLEELRHATTPLRVSA